MPRGTILAVSDKKKYLGVKVRAKIKGLPEEENWFSIWEKEILKRKAEFKKDDLIYFEFEQNEKQGKVFLNITQMIKAEDYDDGGCREPPGREQPPLEAYENGPELGQEPGGSYASGPGAGQPGPAGSPRRPGPGPGPDRRMLTQLERELLIARISVIKTAADLMARHQSLSVESKVEETKRIADQLWAWVMGVFPGQ